jgi:hypothetical protein
LLGEFDIQGWYTQQNLAPNRWTVGKLKR